MSPNLYCDSQVISGFGWSCSGSFNAAHDYAGHTITVIGAGRVGTALAGMVPSGVDLHVVRRGQQVPSNKQGPVYIATHVADLVEVLKATPISRHSDLVFLQNGMLTPWLQTIGLQENTQGLVYFGASKDENGEPVVRDSGQTVVTGRHAGHMVWLLGCGGVGCTELDPVKFEQKSAEKLMWSVVFWLLCAALDNKPVGLLVQEHRDDIDQLVGELLPLAQRAMSPAAISGLDVEEVRERICQYSLAIPNSRPSREMALAEFPWRNGWFLSQERTPLHVDWLNRANVPLHVIDE
mmetsp:Transcript_34726/g.65359  ORF Transcript_34726/g.65359 Transcript_34726/m.65359 type:complete len:294 (+) Transcript_34726:1558-2439(+)|eukprot:CAMPEP_0114306148 /NCGR_PEP_ID=MMETSP0059-20121206/16740_1 /TAXON_ID=36894 /ORGANISM="Pyramimonas parkeae, Strain CCMP726" /LENGTH=293 /DNA_ID=CAMNT_0001429443 /DNA_START=1095 /DNA_END=1976 /DNA_ORIENTATION=+